MSRVSLRKADEERFLELLAAFPPGQLALVITTDALTEGLMARLLPAEDLTLVPTRQLGKLLGLVDVHVFGVPHLGEETDIELSLMRVRSSKTVTARLPEINMSFFFRVRLYQRHKAPVVREKAS